MKYKGIELAVGAFVLGGLGLIIVAIFTILGEVGVGNKDAYFALFKNVSTVAEGTAVKWSGKQVGKVTGVSIDEASGKVRMDFWVASSTPMTTDMEAKITKPDLLGSEYVDLRFIGAKEGTARARLSRGEALAPPGPVTAGEPFDLQAALEGMRHAIGQVDGLVVDARKGLNEAIEKVNSVLSQAEGVLGDETFSEVRSILANMNQTTSKLKGLMEDNAPRLESMLKNADEATADVRVMTAKMRETTEELGPRVTSLTESLEAAVADLRSALTTVDEQVAGVDVQRVNDLVENLELASRNLVEFSAEIKKKPWLLIRKEKEAEKEFH